MSIPTKDRIIIDLTSPDTEHPKTKVEIDLTKDDQPVLTPKFKEKVIIDLRGSYGSENEKKMENRGRRKTRL
ncbi:Protein of unknown function [Pyronema omphalodes CBS 100304]|uniref:Uncharacterized protein n=1 Tax=Pyronema omphalodes (strain CBS 100304) TaxID=1076935 RepID=U4KW46_PYROM|nr:Protein of unknown function [Pyronema omphalodes CBS 100304]